ncbi:MAG: Uma2 family endonuclease [Peptococcaceae bacterium]|nr:Uma2 family endonuclease [Peptococcaceae bacterium]
MNVAKPLTSVTLEEFEQMEKTAHINYELIDGIVLMAPGPSREHQKIAGNLYYSLRTQLHETYCDSIYEMDIKFNGNVYKPDMMVFCDSEAELPEIIFEILSPSTRHTDLRIKVLKYEEMGVKEYWIIDPKVKVITIHDFVNNTAETYSIEDTLYSLAQPELVIPAAKIFEKV